MYYKTTKQVLVDAKAYLETHGFCKGTLFDELGQCCIMGAVARSHDFNKGINEYLEANAALREAIPAEAPRRNLPAYNDRPETTKEDVLALFDRAIESVKE